MEDSYTGKTYLRLKANILYKQGDFQRAAEAYSTLLNVYPGESMFLLAAAKSFKLSSQLRISRRLFRKIEIKRAYESK
ncbi:MAG: hypothetical protein IPO06_25655 [Leptospiraceae bacterium]|nr:hypothetical protein [Leptospiraceae bacterium]